LWKLLMVPGAKTRPAVTIEILTGGATPSRRASTSGRTVTLVLTFAQRTVASEFAATVTRNQQELVHRLLMGLVEANESR